MNDKADDSGTVNFILDLLLQRKKLIKLYNLWVKKSPAVLIYGASGVGKSQFVGNLNDYAFASIDRRDRTRTWVSTEIDTGNQTAKFLDTPGQLSDGDKAIRSQAQLEALRAGNFGIINVVAFGYHEGTAPVDEAAKKASSVWRTKPEFLELNRKTEADAVDEWSGLLFEAKWLITVVNKADLWWTPTIGDSVIDHYRTSGDYHEKIKGWNGKHTVLPYCSIIKPFFGVVPTTGYLGDDMRLMYRSSAFDTLNALIRQDKKI